MSTDKLFIWVNCAGTDLQGGEALRPLLERLADSSMPSPTQLGAKGRPIKGYLDPAVLKMLDKRKPTEKLANPEVGFEMAIVQLPVRTAISLSPSIAHAPPAEELRQLFRDVVALVAPLYACVYPWKAGSSLQEEVYQKAPRSFYADGLWWLNFFGPKEEARQGGANLAENPLARVERLPQGLLMEVGDGPLDILTPEGRQRLIDATRAMPPPVPAGA